MDGVEQEYIDNFDNGINKELILQKINSKDGVIIEYEIKNYVHGSQALRYWGLTLFQKMSGLSSLKMNVKFKDTKSGKLLGEITYLSCIRGGFLGGSGELLDEASAHILEYAKLNYLK